MNMISTTISAKKDDELEGFKQVIFKLQNQLEANKDKEEEQKNRRNTERSIPIYLLMHIIN